MKFLHTIVFMAFFLANTLLSQEYLEKKFVEIQKQLQDSDISVRLSSVDDIDKVLMEGIPPRPQFLHSQNRYDPSHEETVQKLLSLLTTALHDSEGSVRCNAALTFQKAGMKFENGAVGKHLIGLLYDSNRQTRYLAAETLGEIKDKRAIYPLLLMLRDTDPYMRGFAASALGNMQAKKAVDDLIILLDDRSCYRYGRIFAAEALGKLRDRKAIWPLLFALEEEEELIACSAARAIGEMAYMLDAEEARQASGSLFKLLKSKNAYMRHSAGWTIKRIWELLIDRKTANEIESRFLKDTGNKLDDLPNDREFLALQIQKSVPYFSMKIQAPGLGFIQKTFEFKITIAHHGEGPARDAVLSHILARYFDYVSSSPRAKYSPTKRTVVWNLGPIPSGTQREALLRVRPMTGFRNENVFTLTSQGEQCSESAAITVFSCGGVIQMRLEDTEDPVKVGKLTAYILEAQNNATSVLTNVKFECIIPDKMVFASAETPVPYQIKGDSLIFDTIPVMEPDEKLTLKIFCLAISDGSCKLVSIVRYDQFTHPVKDEEGTTIYK